MSASTTTEAVARFELEQRGQDEDNSEHDCNASYQDGDDMVFAQYRNVDDYSDLREPTWLLYLRVWTRLQCLWRHQ